MIVPSLPLRPTLAFKVTDIEKLRYPLLASPKIDGIRCLYASARALSRTFRPIPNRFVQAELAKYASWLHGFDGELVAGTNFQKTASAIMSEEGYPDFTYWVFDIHNSERFTNRLRTLDNLFAGSSFPKQIALLRHIHIQTPQELMAYESECLHRGYEGVMVRHPQGLYKYGRSTEKEGILGKLKRFADSEARVVGVEELLHNDNPPTQDAFGLTERSSDAAALRPGGVMGSLICVDVHGLWGGAAFGIGTGFTAPQRSAIWKEREITLGRLVKYKYLPHGVKDLPRHPVFLGWRTEEDFD